MPSIVSVSRKKLKTRLERFYCYFLLLYVYVSVLTYYLEMLLKNYDDTDLEVNAWPYNNKNYLLLSTPIHTYVANIINNNNNLTIYISIVIFYYLSNINYRDNLPRCIYSDLTLHRCVICHLPAILYCLPNDPESHLE